MLKIIGPTCYPTRWDMSIPFSFPSFGGVWLMRNIGTYQEKNSKSCYTPTTPNKCFEIGVIESCATVLPLIVCSIYTPNLEGELRPVLLVGWTCPFKGMRSTSISCWHMCIYAYCNISIFSFRSTKGWNHIHCVQGEGEYLFGVGDTSYIHRKGNKRNTAYSLGLHVHSCFKHRT